MGGFLPEPLEGRIVLSAVRTRDQRRVPVHMDDTMVHRRAQGIQIGRGFRPVSRVALLDWGIAGTRLALWQAP